MELLKVFNAQNRSGRRSLRVAFQHDDNVYYMDMSQKRDGGTCTVTFWRKVRGGLMYLQQMMMENVNVSIRCAIHCIEKFAKS
jgi:hypothetical protein